VPQQSAAPRRGAARGGVALAAALAAANLCGYAFNVGATRLLGPSAYGALGALLGLVLIFNVVALGLQAVVARRLAVEEPAQRPVTTGALARRGLALSALVGAVAIGAAPLVERWLHLDSVAPALLLGVAMVPLTVFGVIQGILQGSERFVALGGIYVVAALGKVGGGLVGVLVDRSVTAAMLGLCVGSITAAAVSWLWLRPSIGPSGGAGLVGETVHATHAFLALFVLTNVDVLFARHYLEPRAAGLYAAGAVIAKGAFWLPQFVPVLAFPRMADATRHGVVLRRSLAVVMAAGLGVTLVCLFLGDLVVAAIGGSRYAALAGDAWWFAALGACFACSQLLLYGRLAAQDRFAAASVWTTAALFTIAVAAGCNDSLLEIVSTGVVCAALLVVTGIGAQLLRDRRTQPPAHVLTQPTQL
jgi:O-antigen/teichoic acid export membrane protein